MAFAVERSVSKNERLSKAAREREGKGWTGVAGNKRLANPRRQFNLAANPGENVNKDPSLPPSLFRSAASRGTRVLARAQRHFIFAQRYRRRPASDHVEIVCKASCARRPFLFSRLSSLPLPPLSLLPLSAFHPRNLSRLCSERARRNLYYEG